MSSSLIKTVNLSKTFKGETSFLALDNVNISIGKGEFVSIVGQSGSGKSTLLYVLSTLDTEYQGQIFLDNIDLGTKTANQLASIRNEEIGFVFQFHYLLPEFTVLENVCLPARKLGKLSLGQIEDAAISKLELLGLKDQAHKRASQLSGGQQQRVAIARALINEPKIIFGDEPTGNLDSANSSMVFEIFKDLVTQTAQTIIIVTHDNDIASKTDRRITLKDGKVIA
jgi:lipoprotein-releasing system ATP-binding protein